MLHIESIRKDFPILDQKVYGKPLIYFDNAATTQKPACVINALTEYYTTLNSNIHRGAHYLSNAGTAAFEEVRKTVQQFINAKHSHEVIFTKGATESINLVASSFGKRFLQKGDEVLVSQMEHHANIVPWQIACETSGAKLKVIPMTEAGELDMAAFDLLLTTKTRIVAVAHVSNALGTINPIKEIIAKAHALQVPVLIDGAQSIAHEKIDVQELDCDFFCFSGHKMYAPMGTGIVYGKETLLNEMPPYQGGGEMIKEVTFEKTTYNDLPFKFEAGTPSVADMLGLQKAIEYMQALGIENIAAYEHQLLDYCTERLKEIESIRFIGTSAHKAGAISFLLNGAHPSDVGKLLDLQGVAVRTGHHCAQTVMDFYKIQGTVRVSFAFYNTKEEIDIFIEALKKAETMLS